MNLTAQQRKIADQIVSAFENSTTQIQYDYCKNLKDGRGYTAGRAGFCTGTGDLYQVVKLYTIKNPKNVFSKYLDTLKQLAENEDDDVSELEDFKNVWKTACQDSAFLACQDEIVNQEYYRPSLKYAQELGLQNAFSLVCLFDTCIQHGDGIDGDSIGSLIKKTNDQIGGSPKNGVDEKEWVYTFLDIRREDLVNPENKATQQEWKGSVGRVDALKHILKTDNMQLKNNIEFTVFGDDFKIIA